MAGFVPLPQPSAAPERDLVRRDALLRALRRSQPDVVILVGPGGSGKSMTAKQMAPLLGDRSCWVGAAQALSPGGLLREIVALGREPASAQVARDLIASSPTPHGASAAMVAAAEGLSPIVFEDIHGWPVASRETMALFLEAATVRSIVTTRDLGSIDVGRIAGRRRLRIFAFEDLAFSTAEIATLARVRKKSITAQDARGLYARTSGLPMGVALLLRYDAGENNGTFLLERYIGETVAPTLRLPEREVAYLAGLLNGRVGVAAMEACLGVNGRRGIRRLVDDLSVAHEREGALVVHDVFLAALANEPAPFDEPAGAVRHRFAQTLEDSGYIAEALQVLRTTDKAHALDLLARHADWFIEHGFADLARDVMDHAPQRARRASAPLLGLEAHLLMRSGDLRRAATLLRHSTFPPGEREQLVAQLATLLSNQGSGEGRTILREAGAHARGARRAEILSALAVSEAIAGEGPACRTTLRRLHEAIDSVEDNLARVRMMQRSATALLYLGDFGNAEDAALETIALAKRGSLEVQLANAHSILYATRHLLDDLTGAGDAARLMEAHAVKAGDEQTAASAAVAQLLIATERGDLVGARRAEEAVERYGRAHGFRDRFAYGYARALLDVALHEPQLARRRLDVLLRRSDLQPEEYAICAAVRACLRRAEEPVEQRRQDVDLAQRFLAESSAMHVLSARTQVFAYCFAAIAARNVGRYRKASQYALKATALARTGGQRVFSFAVTLLAETGGDRAVRDCARILTEGGLAGYADFVTAVSSTRADRSAAPDLTQAEQAVLVALAAGLSVKGIAKHRSTSANTVRVQIQRLHRKFECSTNNDLISRARDLGAC